MCDVACVPATQQTEVLSTARGKFECFSDDDVTQHLRRFGAHQGSELSIALDCVRPGDAIVDVGAHVGTFSVPLAQRVGEAGRVTAFEGAADTYSLLLRNLEANGCANVDPVHAVVSSEAGGSFRKADPEAPAGSTHFEPADEGGGVTAVTLDQWRQGAPRPVRFIKLDIEGHELDALRGAERLLREDRPIVLLEISRSQLRRRGSSLRDLDRVLSGYHLFVNLASRSSEQGYRLARLPRLALLRAGGRDFGHLDALAVPPGSDRYPRNYSGQATTLRLLASSGLRALGRRVRG